MRIQDSSNFMVLMDASVGNAKLEHSIPNFSKNAFGNLAIILQKLVEIINPIS